MLHPLKAVLFIERDILFVLWHSLDISVVLIFFFDTFQHLSGNALPLIIRMYQHIVNCFVTWW